MVGKETEFQQYRIKWKKTCSSVAKMGIKAKGNVGVGAYLVGMN